MAIRVKCPNSACGKEYNLKDELAGKTVRCSVCRQSFEVPVPAGPTSADGGTVLLGKEAPKPPQPSVQAAIPPKPGTPGPPLDPLIGAKIAHYRIQTLLGEGGMGKVYKAHNTSLDKTSAIKILPQEFAKQDQSNIDRFLREARSAAKVEHPNVLPVHFVGKVGENYFIEMQYVDGGTLGGLLKQRSRLPVKEAARVIRDVAAGLHAAHEKGIIHRDMKPTNVMLTAKGHVYVMDFGLAKSAQARTALTASGTIMGTPLYISPEQATAQPVDQRSDIYSLGVMFYQIVAGTPPYEADSALALISQQIHAPIPDVRRAAPEVPPQIAAMIRKMMAKEPAERYQSCAEVVEELAAFLAAPDQPAVVVPGLEGTEYRRGALARAKKGAPSRPAAGEAKKRPAAPVVLLLVLLLVLILGAVSYFAIKKPAAPGASATESALARVAQPPSAVPPEQTTESPWDDAYVATAATGEKIPHPLSRKTYKQTLADGTTIDVPEGMVYVPAGEFTMGEKESEHQVYLDAYFIGRYEVTNAEWKAFTDATGFTPRPLHWKDGKIPDSRENHPVVNVSWDDMQTYCEWVSKNGGRALRLPTDAQWEKAASWGSRTSRKNLYPWGDTWDPGFCNWQGAWAAKYGLKWNPTDGVPDDQWSAFIKTDKYLKEICAGMGGMAMPVGSFPKGKCFYGCYDMAGNACEWCQDWFTTNYYKLNGARENPAGPTEEQAELVDFGGKKMKVRVLRGGGWLSNAFRCRTGTRSRHYPSCRDHTLGFRVVVVPSKPAGAGQAPPEGGAAASAPTATAKSAWDGAYVATAATGEKIPHPLSRKTYKQTLADGTTVDCPEGMVCVPAGEFRMGKKESVHKVYLDAYFIGKYEVTNAEWKAFCDLTGFTPLPWHWKSGTIPLGKENHPVVYVSWEDIQKYCEWVSKETGRKVSLPTEAQWEKAAGWNPRKKHHNEYPWGDEFDPKSANHCWQLGCRCDGDSNIHTLWWQKWSSSDEGRRVLALGGNTAAAKQFKEDVSCYQCFDMGGNVSEWVGDWFRTDYYRKSGQRNPTGPTEEEAENVRDGQKEFGPCRVWRGGDWSSNRHNLRAVNRPRSVPAHRSYGIGFRCAIDYPGDASEAPPKASGAGGEAPTPAVGAPATTPTKSPWDDAYVTTAATGNKIPHPLSRKTYKQTLADGTTIEVPEGMVYVPAGEFTMGENESEHEVYMDAYFIGRYEVTNAEWKAFVDATRFAPPPYWKGGEIPQGKENHPAVSVSWEDIQKYCEWVSRESGRNLRLPTEAQWEKAARGPQGYTYPWGNQWDPGYCNWQGIWAAKYGLKGNLNEGAPSEQWTASTKSEKYTKETSSVAVLTMPVGSFPKGKCFYGCYDMAGNAYEWCQDWFMASYYDLSDARRNPAGPTEGQAEECDFSGQKKKARLLRGGAWNNHASTCRCVSRFRAFPSNRYSSSYGFRVVVLPAR